MIAMELNGTHIGKTVKLTYPMKYTKKQLERYKMLRQQPLLTVSKRRLIQEIHHYAKGDMKVNWNGERFPYNAEVEFVD